jgi:TRAP-type C4-dicarboxylate transport system substrate-binding protein
MLADAARESAAFQRGRARSMEGAALENLRKHGMVVTRLPDGEARKMADLLRPVTDKTLKALPGRGCRAQAGTRSKHRQMSPHPRKPWGP